MKSNKETMVLSNGDLVYALSPIIVSASRSTDIPAFYSKWFFDRLEKGYSCWKNPFNGKLMAVSYEYTRFIVFWSKNPRPLLDYINRLGERRINCYIQYTLNDYVKEGLEKNVPSVDFRIDTFKRLVDRLGMGRVIWRFDPLILTDSITSDDLLSKIEYIGDRLQGYTEKLVFSFVDIINYAGVKRNLEKNNIHYINWEKSAMLSFAKGLAELNRKWSFQLATCGEQESLAQYGIAHNKCIDDDLIIRLAYNDKVLMDYLGVTIEQNSLFGKPDDALDLENGYYAIKKYRKAAGQREFCGCIDSKDIGEYNTCPHFCEYCYANRSKEAARANWERHLLNPDAEMITG